MDLQSFNAALLAMFNKALTAVEQGASFLAGELPDVVQQFLLYKLVVSAAAWPFFLISMPLGIYLWLKEIYLRRTEEHLHNMYIRSRKTVVEQALVARIQHLQRMRSACALSSLGLLCIAAISLIVGCLSLPDLIKVTIAPKLYIVEYAAHLIRK